jgi:hypothetical protein
MSAAEQIVDDLLARGDLIHQVTPDGELQEHAEALARIRLLIGELRQMEADLTDAIAGQMTSQQTQVGPWRLERRKGSTRKGWDSEGLLSELIRRARFDVETGEQFSDAQTLAHLLSDLRACVPFTASLGWRAGPLRERGMDPDEWCETTPGPWRVDVMPVIHPTDTETTTTGDQP